MVAERAVIGPGCVVGRDSRVGAESVLVSNVSICHRVSIGARVLIHSGVVIGSDGFGLANNDGVWEKVPQLGGVTIEDDVEIGANTTIDRGALDDTIIEARGQARQPDSNCSQRSYRGRYRGGGLCCDRGQRAYRKALHYRGGVGDQRSSGADR